MCLIAIAWQTHPRYALVVAANRDEWRARPAEPAHFWSDRPEILAGRDEQAGGTWLGIARNGRFAAVTNFRDPSDVRATARSRGELVTSFLSSRDEPRAFLEKIALVAREYNGFNLIAGDGSSLFYYGSTQRELSAIAPGVHALSNHTLDEPWPKVTRARAALDAALHASDAAADAESLGPPLFAMLSDRSAAPDAELPDTGVGLAWERRLSPPLIVGADYGTRVSTVLVVERDGHARLVERTLDEAGAVTGVAAFALDVGHAYATQNAASTK